MLFSIFVFLTGLCYDYFILKCKGVRKVSKTKSLKIGVIISYISLFAGNIISLIYTPIMLRLLGQSEYGLYSLASTFVGYLGLLSFGFSSAYICYFSRYKVKQDTDGIARLNGMFLTIFSVVGLLAVLAGGVLVASAPRIFSQGLTPAQIHKAKLLMKILIANLALSFPLSVFDSYITANEAYVFQKTLALIKSILSPLVLLPVLFMGFRSVGLVVASSALNIGIGLVNILFSAKRLSFRAKFGAFDLSLFKEIAVFSSFIFINIIVDQINWNVDKFLLGIFKSTVAVAIYGLASQLNTYYISFSTTVSSVFIPRVHQLVSQGDNDRALTQLFTRIGRIQFMILSLIATGLIFFGKPFIMRWAGDNYENSYAIALLLILPVTIPSIQNIGIEIQRAKNMHKFRSGLYLGIAIANVLCSIPLCRLYGGVGCAIGTAASLITR